MKTISTMARVFGTGACAMLALGVAAVPAQAGSIVVTSGVDTVTKELRVDAADLNLNNNRGRQTLVRRINVAAARVCDLSYAGDPRLSKDESRCFVNAKAAAMVQMQQHVAMIENTSVGTR